jgi:hypothetical protein
VLEHDETLVASTLPWRYNPTVQIGLHFGLFTDPRPEGHGRKLMLRLFLRTCILVGCFSLVSLAATAQEVVHALSGTITSIDASAKTITVNTDDGSQGLFKDMTDSNIQIEFDPNIRKDTTAADEFQKSGVRVIVYYFGTGDIRTVVALRSLGAGPFTITSGSIVKFNKVDQTFSIKDTSGMIKTFNISSDMVAEISTGASEKSGFHPSKGDSVRVTAAMVNGSATALFINTLVAN